MSLEIKLAYDDLDNVKKLFYEYTEFLIKSDQTFSKYLTIQSYENELNDLSIKYGLPKGRLYIAYLNKKPSGCIALKPLDEKTCELKRLYLKPEFRGLKISNKLVKKIITDARDIGYNYIVLDTLPFLKNALKLYKKFGFYEIEPYTYSPMKDSIFLKYDLKSDKQINKNKLYI